MTTSEKVAYLKGLAEGMGIQEDGGQGKLIKVITDILEDLALDMADTRDTLTELADSVEDLGADLSQLEEDFFDCCCGDDDEEEDGDEDGEDDEDTVFYALECPGCGYKLTVDESILDEGTFECPECGEVIDLTKTELEEVDFNDEDDEDNEELPF